MSPDADQILKLRSAVRIGLGVLFCNLQERKIPLIWDPSSPIARMLAALGYPESTEMTEAIAAEINREGESCH